MIHAKGERSDDITVGHGRCEHEPVAEPGPRDVPRQVHEVAICSDKHCDTET